MSTILVVDDMAIFRDPIAASLRLSGYETLCAADGEEALRITRAKRPDLILLDVAMPKMDGITFLKRLRADKEIAGTRVILLTAITDKKYVVAAATLGAGDYLLKSRFRLKDLLERITKQLNGPGPAAPSTGASTSSSSSPPGKSAAPAGAAPGTAGASASAATAPAASTAAAVSAQAAVPTGPVEIPRLLNRDDCIRKAEGVVQGKTLAGIITQIISVATSPRGDTVQLASLIARDPIMSARVLQAANSAAYTSAAAIVTDIPDAIRKIGCTTVRNIAAALGIFDAMPEPCADGFNPIRCWQHSFAVAQLCERLVASKDEEQAGLAYVVGLCHDLGEILIHTHFRAEYQQVLEMTTRTGRPREQLEREMLGMTHAELTKTVFKCLALPDQIREPVEVLHGINGERSKDPLVQALWMAENYANGIMLASSPASTVAPLMQALCKSATGNANPERPDSEMLRSEVLCLTAMLARLSKTDEAQLLAPLFKPSSVRLWLARDPSLSTFDPIEIALRSMAEVDVQDRLPTVGEAGGVSGLIVVSRTPEVAGFSPADVDRLTAELRRAGRTLPFLYGSCVPGSITGGVPTTFRLSALADFVAALSSEAPVPAAA